VGFDLCGGLRDKPSRRNFGLEVGRPLRFFLPPLSESKDMNENFWTRVKHTLLAFLILLTGQQETVLRALMWLIG
jgi:hypothetical protein